MDEVEKRLEAALIETIEKWVKDGCATAEEMKALAAVAQVLVNLERAGFGDIANPCGTMAAAFHSAIHDTGAEEITT